jgi:hypothetical protein
LKGWLIRGKKKVRIKGNENAAFIEKLLLSSANDSKDYDAHTRSNSP